MKVFDLHKIVRPHIWSLVPYSSARDEFTGDAEVFLDANENPLGSATAKDFNRYPDPHHVQIKARIAAIAGVESENILLGNGSDEIIDLLIRATCEPGKDEVMIFPPTYGMYEVSASVNNVGLIVVRLTPDFQLDVKKATESLTHSTKIVWVCSPNNPSGNLLKTEDIETLLAATSGIVVVDEAYIDFTENPSWIRRLSEFPNLVVMQTFSKAWGMAGLRAGMCFASAEIVRVLNKIKPPYNLGLPVQQYVFEGLENIQKKELYTQEIIRQRSILKENLLKIPSVIEVYPSEANFLLVKMTKAPEIMQYLRDSQIIVRDRSKTPGCDQCLRISVGTEKENELLLLALKKFEENSIIVE